MSIEDIIYDTTRELLNVEDKLRIATLFLFCREISNLKFSELLYIDNHEDFICQLNADYSKYEVDFTLNFSNKNISNSFYKTLEKVKAVFDSNGYYKALFEKDEFALAIENIINTDLENFMPQNFNERFDRQLRLKFKD